MLCMVSVVANRHGKRLGRDVHGPSHRVDRMRIEHLLDLRSEVWGGGGGQDCVKRPSCV